MPHGRRKKLVNQRTTPLARPSIATDVNRIAQMAQSSAGSSTEARTVNQSDKFRYRNESQYYSTMLTSYVRSIVVGTISLALCLLPAAFPGSEGYTVSWVYISLCMIIFITQYITSITCYFKMHFYLCPRCGKRFNVTKFNSVPRIACKHCGLNLRQEAM